MRQRKRWPIVVAAMGVSGLLILGVILCHNWPHSHLLAEKLLGETPQARVDAYLAAVRRGDRAAALASWPLAENAGPDLGARRERVTDELLALGSRLSRRAAGVEWWRNCCSIGVTHDPAAAGVARIWLDLSDGQGTSRRYVFDVVTATPYWGEAAGNPVRHWLLRDVYPDGERPLAFPWPRGVAPGLAPATGGDVPQAVQSALALLARRFRAYEPGDVTLWRWERVDWPDGCLGIATSRPCTEAIVPGYRIVVRIRGREYEYRSSMPEAEPYRLLLAAGPDPGVTDAALSWQQETPDGCWSLRLAADGRAAVGPCDMPPAPRHLFDYPGYVELQREWTDLVARFAPFQADTPVGRITFVGQGHELASPARQRAIAAWARLARLELEGELARQPGQASALTWRRGGAQGRLLLVEASGWAAAIAVREPHHYTYLGQGWLEDRELEQLDAWLYGRSPYERDGLALKGTPGAPPLSEEDLAAIERWAEAVLARLAEPWLTVEEHPLAGQPPALQAPSPQVLDRRRPWRDPSLWQRAAQANQTLVNYAYRLVPKEQPGQRGPLLDLYRLDRLVLADLTAIWPLSPASPHDGFALVVEQSPGLTWLVRREGAERWPLAERGYTAPVLVGGDLVWVQTVVEDAQYAVHRGEQTVYTLTLRGPRLTLPIRGLWAWEGHWILEADGRVVMDGRDLGRERGHERVFGWHLVQGSALYFFEQGSRIGVSYGGQELPCRYDQVIRYAGPEAAAFEVSGNQTMVWFHALRDGAWYYVEMGVYR